MNSEWRTIRFGDLGTIITGKTPSTKCEDNFGVEVPFVTPRDLQKSKHIFATDRYLSYMGSQTVKNCILPPNSICVSCIGNLGYVGITTVRSVTNQQINVIVPSSSFCHDFLYYYIKYIYPQFKHLENQSTTLSIINKTQFSNLEITVPSFSVQKAIAATLSCLDDKIELNNRMNKTLEEMAQAIFKSWFVDFEPFQDGEFVDSELGRIPMGWKVGFLEEISNITMGQSPSGSSFNTDGIGTVFYQGSSDFGDRFPIVRKYTSEPNRLAEINDILLSVRAPVGEINVAYENCCIGRGLAAISGKDKFESFTFYLLRNSKDKFNVFNSEGTVFGSINKDSLRRMKIVIPCIEQIILFQNTVEWIDKMIRTLTQEIRTLQSLRDTLLPKLMSGEIRVPIQEE